MSEKDFENNTSQATTNESQENVSPESGVENDEAPEDDQYLREKVEKFIAEGEGSQESIQHLVKRIDDYLPYADEILEKIGIDFTATKSKLLELAKKDADEDLVEAILPIAQEILRFKQELPELEEKIERKRLLRERGFESLDDENFVTFEVKDDGWTHLHIAPGHTLGDKKYLLMIEGILKLAEEIKKDEGREGISLMSYLVASDTYKGFLEALGFTMDGKIDEEERQQAWKEYSGDTEIHKAHIDKGNMDLLHENAKMFYEQLKKIQTEKEE